MRLCWGKFRVVWSNFASFSTSHNALHSSNIRNRPIILVETISGDHESAVSCSEKLQQKCDHHGDHIGRS